MEKDTQERLVSLVKQYPKIQIQDIIKRLYQNSFGPQHMTSNANIQGIMAYIEHELGMYQACDLTEHFEYIGNGYYRVSLGVIENGIMDIHDMAQAFYQSMVHSPIMDDQSIRVFNDQLILCLKLIKKKILPFDFDNAKSFIERYLDSGIRPIHHSQIYRETYHPHYRLIHQSYLKAYIKETLI